MRHNHRDAGFLSRNLHLVFDLVVGESILPSPNWYDIKMALWHISAVFEMYYSLTTELRENGFYRQVDVMLRLVEHIYPANHHSPLCWDRKQKYFASAILRLLSGKLRRDDYNESLTYDLVTPLIYYIKVDYPSLVEARGASTYPGFVTLIYENCARIFRMLELESCSGSAAVSLVPLAFEEDDTFDEDPTQY
jgi:hypothetical protein